MGLRAELKAACLALWPSIDAALIAAGLDPLAAMEGPTDEDTGRLALPRMMVSLAGPRERAAYTSGQSPAVEERLVVEFVLQIDGTEDEALGYEDAILPVLSAAWATIDAAVSGARLGEWYPDSGDLGADDEGTDATQRGLRMPFRAMLEW